MTVNSWVALVLPVILLVPSPVSSLDPIPRLNSSISFPEHYWVQLTLDVKTKKHFVDLFMWFTVLKQTRFIQLHSKGLNVPWSEATLQLGDEEGVYPIEWVEDKATEIVTLTFQRKIRVGKFHSLVFRKISGDFGEGFHEVDLGRGR